MLGERKRKLPIVHKMTWNIKTTVKVTWSSKLRAPTIKTTALGQPVLVNYVWKDVTWIPAT